MSHQHPQRQPEQQRIVLGEITGAHGLAGEVRVRIAGDSPDHLLAVRTVWLGRSATDPESRRYSVTSAGLARGGEVRMRLEGVDRREAVSSLVGQLVTAPAHELPVLPDGEYYWYQLIGCEVYAAAGECVGTVREIWETGAHDVLVVRDEDGVRRLVPTAAELMTEIDLEGRRIVMADLPGLLEPA